jgi:hypothetical protein
MNSSPISEAANMWSEVNEEGKRKGNKNKIRKRENTLN